ncbi:hypothetical protein KCU92_g6234, partial [Aureobasidium melanogenum]|jgi:hypothetical protein
MKDYHMQLGRTFREVASSFATVALCAVTVYLCSSSVLDNIMFAIKAPEIAFATDLKIGEFVWCMLLEICVISVLFQKLVTSFRSSLLPVVKLAIDAFNTGRQDKKQARLPAECDEHKSQQQPATPQPREQAESSQEYQAWRKQFETHIREDSKSTTLTYSPAPLFLLHKNSGCIHCSQHIITSSDALQAYYSKANLSDEDFNKDRMYWHILAEESNIKYNACKISILKGRKEFMKRGLAAIANEVEQALFDLRGTEQED